MKKSEVQGLRHGLYVIKWRDDERTSLAAVGSNRDGDRWLAPTNWISSGGSPELP